MSGSEQNKTTGKKPKERMFFEAPDHVQTPAQIVAAARNSLRTINTRRPETPQDGQRKLFGEQSVRDPTNRPPSAFSLGSGHFNESESRPVSGTRLIPLDHRPRSLSIEVDGAIAPKPPTDPNRPMRRPGSRQRLYQQSISIDASSGNDAQSPSHSGSLTDVAEAAVLSPSPVTSPGDRRVHSGTKERPHRNNSEDRRDSKPGTPTRAEHRKRILNSAEGERTDPDANGDLSRDGSAGSQRVSSAGKPGSAGRREEETLEEALYYNTYIGPIVEEMATHIREKDYQRLADLSDELYTALETGNLLGKACKRRPSILKTIFKLLDLEAPGLLLKLARLIFSLKVSGNNLVNVCKLVFKVSRVDKNDSYFMEGNILDYLIETSKSADIVTSSDALVYCVGVLKFLSGNSEIVEYLVKKNCVEAMAKLLASLNAAHLESGKPIEQHGHILVQLTASLRNLTDVKDTWQLFLSLRLIDDLCKLMEVHSHDGDLMLNICRIFSKLIMHPECCTAVAKRSSHFKSFVHLLQKYQKREDLVVRICFILGNLTAKDDLARKKLVKQSRSVDAIVHVMKHYSEVILKVKSEKRIESSTRSSTDEPEDVLIKAIRVVANLSVNKEIGCMLAANAQCIQILLQILSQKTLESSEELVLNSIATINNLSYYNLKDSAITISQLSIAESLLSFLEAKNLDGLAEATRVFGNLSRDKPVRDFLVENQVDEAMIAMLDSGHHEVVYTACGVLINLMADEEKRKVLIKQGGVQKLVDVLRDFGQSDWQLASLVCQTLWNYSSKITSSNACFGEEESGELQDILIEFLDEEAALDNPEFDDAMKDYIQDVWENKFRPVASKLLDRIESHQSSFEAL